MSDTKTQRKSSTTTSITDLNLLKHQVGSLNENQEILASSLNAVHAEQTNIKQLLAENRLETHKQISELSKNFSAQISALSSSITAELNSSMKFPWTTVLSASGLLLSIIIAIATLTINPIFRAQEKHDNRLWELKSDSCTLKRGLTTN